MLDVIGIGSLNLDLIITSEKLGSLPTGEVNRAYSIIESCSGAPASLRDVDKVLSLLGRDSFRESLGGSAFNTVHALAELGLGIRTGFVGVAGSTGSRRDFLELMEGLSIDTTCVDVSPEERSGICLCINRGGRRSLLIYPGSKSKIAGHIRKNRKKILAQAAGARILHITSLGDPGAGEAIAGLVEEARQDNPGITVSFDPGLAWVKNITPAIERIMRTADIIFLSTQEFNHLSGAGPESDHREKARRIYGKLGLQRSTLVAKLKPDIRVYSRCGVDVTEMRFVNRVVDFDEISDATGAGDMFDAGFLAVLLRSGTGAIREAAELGSSFAYAKLSSAGDDVYRELERICREKFYKPESR